MSLIRKCHPLISCGPVGLFFFWGTWNSGNGGRLKLIPMEDMGFGGHVLVQLGFLLPHPNLVDTQGSSCNTDPRITWHCFSPGRGLFLIWAQQEGELLAQLVSVSRCHLCKCTVRPTGRRNEPLQLRFGTAEENWASSLCMEHTGAAPTALSHLVPLTGISTTAPPASWPRRASTNSTTGLTTEHGTPWAGSSGEPFTQVKLLPS